MRQLIFWMPLVVGVLFASFFSILVLHTWGQGHDILETLRGVIMQILPTILLAITLVLSWSWNWMGAVFFAGLGALLG